MKRCEELNLQFSEYLEGVLPENSRRELEAHVKDCIDCFEGLQTVRRLLGVLDGLKEVEAPAELRERVMKRIYSLSAPKQERHEWLLAFMPWKWPVPVTAVAAVSVVGLFLVLWQSTKEGTPLARGPEKSESTEKATLTPLVSPASVQQKGAGKGVVTDLAITAVGQKIFGKPAEMPPQIAPQDKVLLKSLSLLVSEPIEATRELKQWLASIPESSLTDKEDRWVVVLPASREPDLMKKLGQTGRLGEEAKPSSSEQLIRIDLYLVEK